MNTLNPFERTDDKSTSGEVELTAFNPTSDCTVASLKEAVKQLYVDQNPEHHAPRLAELQRHLETEVVTEEVIETIQMLRDSYAPATCAWAHAVYQKLLKKDTHDEALRIWNATCVLPYGVWAKLWAPQLPYFHFGFEKIQARLVEIILGFGYVGISNLLEYSPFTPRTHNAGRLRENGNTLLFAEQNTLSKPLTQALYSMDLVDFTRAWQHSLSSKKPFQYDHFKDLLMHAMEKSRITDLSTVPVCVNPASEQQHLFKPTQSLYLVYLLGKLQDLIGYTGPETSESDDEDHALLDIESQPLKRNEDKKHDIELALVGALHQLLNKTCSAQEFYAAWHAKITELKTAPWIKKYDLDEWVLEVSYCLASMGLSGAYNLSQSSGQRFFFEPSRVRETTKTGEELERYLGVAAKTFANDIKGGTMPVPEVRTVYTSF